MVRFCFVMIPPPRRSTLFPYTTLFRSPMASARNDFPSEQRPNLIYSCIHGTRSILNWDRSEEHTSELQSLTNLVSRLLLAKKKVDMQQQADTVYDRNVLSNLSETPLAV